MDKMVVGDKWEPRGGRLYTHWQQYSYRIFPAGESANHNERIDIFDTREQMESDEVTHPYMYDQMAKSLIGYPGEGATVPLNPDGKIEVLGVAWAGDDDVVQVELSPDEGETWYDTSFFGPTGGDFSWRMFRYMWDVPEPDTGESAEFTLVSRATDEHGRSQPAEVSGPDADASANSAIQDDQYPWNSKGYGNTAYMPHAVTFTVEGF